MGYSAVRAARQSKCLIPYEAACEPQISYLIIEWLVTNFNSPPSFHIACDNWREPADPLDWDDDRAASANLSPEAQGRHPLSPGFLNGPLRSPAGRFLLKDARPPGRLGGLNGSVTICGHIPTAHPKRERVSAIPMVGA